MEEQNKTLSDKCNSGIMENSTDNQINALKNEANKWKTQLGYYILIFILNTLNSLLS